MAKNSFTMYTQKQGRMKYLLLTMIPALVLMYFSQYLTRWGILPGGSTWGLVYTCVSMTVMGVSGYLLIFKKNHQIDVQDNTIIETDWLRKEACRIKSTQIHSVRRNFLKEVILLDHDGKKMLCVEANMSNFDKFEQWLEIHTR